MEVAHVPDQTMISTEKSSIAQYKISSICGFNLWISSINKISPSWIQVKIEIISDCFSIAGPDVCLRLTHISFEIMSDNVVLPSQGGQ